MSFGTVTIIVDNSLSVELGLVCNKPLFSDVVFTFESETDTLAINNVPRPPTLPAAVASLTVSGESGYGDHDDSCNDDGGAGDGDSKTKVAVFSGKAGAAGRTRNQLGPVIYGHKIILAARSEIFKTMFQTDPNGLFVVKHNPRGNDDDGIDHHDGTASNAWTCNITDIEPEIMETVMKYIYTDTLETEQLTVEMVLAILYAAKKYLLDGLITKCTNFLNTKMCPDNIHLLLNSLNLLTDDCVTKVLSLIKQKQREILLSPSFMEFEVNAICYVLQDGCFSNTLNTEVDIFNWLIVWAKEKCKRKELVANGPNIRLVLGPALTLIRFPIMTIIEFVQKVVPEKILTTDEEIWILRTIANGGIPVNIPDEEYNGPSFGTKKR